MDKLSQVEEFFAQYKQRPDNQVCFDCKGEDAVWASVNNGILCCYDCIQVHRTLGTEYSIVRSTQLDMWTMRQLTQMDKGGNSELFKWFQKYDLNSESILVKYKSRAAQYYRYKLEANTGQDSHQLEMLAFQGEPSINDGRKSVAEDQYPSTPQGDNYNEQHAKEDFDEDRMHDPDTIQPQHKTEQQKEKLDWKQKLFFGAKSVINTIEEKAIKVKDSELVTKVKGKIEENKVTKVLVHHGKQVGGFISEKAKVVGDKIDKSERLSKARDTTKEKTSILGKKISVGFGNMMTKMGFKKEKHIDEDGFEQVDLGQPNGEEINNSASIVNKNLTIQEEDSKSEVSSDNPHKNYI